MINLSDFDLSKFLLDDTAALRSRDLIILDAAIKDIARQKRIVCLLAAPGTGVENFFEKQKQQNPEQIFIVSLKSGDIGTAFADLMMDLEFGHRQVNWYSTPIINIVEALIYYLKQINNRTVLVFDNCDFLKLPVLNRLFIELPRFRGNAGIIIRLTPSFGEKIIKSSDVFMRSFLAQAGKFVVDYATEDELTEACQNSGIINKNVASSLVKGTLDYDVITTRVSDLRREVKEYLNRGAKNNA